MFGRSGSRSAAQARAMRSRRGEVRPSRRIAAGTTCVLESAGVSLHANGVSASSAICRGRPPPLLALSPLTTTNPDERTKEKRCRT
jgi:hypothetical protein